MSPRIALLLVLIVAAGTMQPARADTLDTLLDITATVLGEPWLKDARPLIECVSKSGPSKCAAIQVKAQGQAAVKQVMPNDPLIAKAVKLIQALSDKDWFAVLELAGTGALQVACKAGLVSAGPMKNFICGAAANLAEPVVKTVMVAIKNPSVPNLVSAIGALADPALACKVVPDFAGKDALCGPLGDVIKLGKELGSEAAKLGMDVGKFAVNVGTGALSVPGQATEALCELATLCDDDDNHKKYLSTNDYYKYLVFPYIQKWVLGRLQSLADTSGLEEKSAQVKCLMYYDYYAYQKSFPPIAVKINERCNGIVARFHEAGEALASSLKAGAQQYILANVNTQVPYSALEDYGKGTADAFATFMSAACASSLKGGFPMPWPPDYSYESAWQRACTAVFVAAKAAWNAQNGKITAALNALHGAGCVNPPGWSAAQGIKLKCDTYAAYQQCLTALAAGEEQAHCAVDQSKADAALASSLTAQLGAKRCKATGANVACTRPWKFEQCQQLRGALSLPPGMTSKVSCSEGPKVAIIAFVAQSQQAQKILYLLNGGNAQPPSAAGSPASSERNTVVLHLPATGTNCAATWDPLAIACNSVPDLSAVEKAFPNVAFPLCAKDPAHDGADAPCRVAAPAMSATAVIPPAKNEPPMPDQSRNQDQPMHGKVPADAGREENPRDARFVQVPTTAGNVSRDADLNTGGGSTPRPILKRVHTAPLKFIGVQATRDTGRGSGGAGPELILPPTINVSFSVPYSFSDVHPQLLNATIRCVASAGPKTQPLGAGQTTIAIGGRPRSGRAEIQVRAGAGEKLQDARAYTCALQVSDGKMSITPQLGTGPNWARANRSSVFMVSGAID